jgi:peptide/nickel transport system permease protein
MVSAPAVVAGTVHRPASGEFSDQEIPLMLAFIIRRFATGLIVILGVVTMTFVVARVLPTNPERLYVGPRATPEQIEKARHELGLDKPMYIQLIDYIQGVSTGDFGRSLVTKRKVLSDIAKSLPPTLELILLAEIIALGVGLPMGVLSAHYQDRWQDHTSRVFAVGFASMPVFWSALLLQYILFLKLRLLPFGGVMSDELLVLYTVPEVTRFPLVDAIISGQWVVVLDQLVHLIMPATVLSLFILACVMRLTRTAMIEILHMDYITVARSYGYSERTVLWKFALKNSLGPTAVIVAVLTGQLITSTFIIEALFAWPGIGSYITNAAISVDFPAILGVTIVAAVAIVLLNMVADMITALDPRVRRGS